MDVHADLQEWLEFLRRDAPVLRRHPHLFFQQAANQPDATAPSRAAAHRNATGKERRVWLKWINKRNAVSAIQVSLVGHTREVRACSWSPDGSRIASGGYDSTVRVWDAATGEELATLTGLHLVEHCVFSPDGHRLAAVDERGRVSLWDAASASLIADADPHVGQVTTCLFSRDGMRLITVGSYTAKVRDARTGAVILIVAHDTVQRLGHDPDRALRQEFEHPTDDWRERLDGLVSTLGAVVSPDGSVILLPFSDASSSEAGVWSLETGRLICRISSTFWRGEFAPDGSRLVTIDQTDRLTLWNPTTGARLTDLGDTAYRWTFSHDGSRLAVTSYERDAVPVLWETGTGVKLMEFSGNHRGSGKCVMSDDGRRLVTYNGNNAVLWDTGTGTSIAVLDPHKAPITHCIFSSDGTRLVTASEDSTLRIFHAADGHLHAHLVGHQHEIHALAFSSDGARLASGSDDGTLNIWSAWWEGTAEFTFRGFTQFCKFSNCGSALATLHWDALVKLWDATTGMPLATLFGRGFDGDKYYSGNDIAFSPDGRRLCCAMTGSQRGPMLRLWDVPSTSEIPLPDAPDLPQTVCRFSPDGAWLVTGGTDGLTLRDGQNGRRLDRVDQFKIGAPIAAHRVDRPVDRGAAYIRACDVAPTGLIVVGTDSGGVAMWRIATDMRLEFVRTFAEITERGDDIRFCAFLAGDEQILAAAHTATIWDVATGAIVRRLERDAFEAARQVLEGTVVTSPNRRYRIARAESGFVVRTAHDSVTIAECHDDGLSDGSAWSPDGGRIAIGDSYGGVRLYELRNT